MAQPHGVQQREKALDLGVAPFGKHPVYGKFLPFRDGSGDIPKMISESCPGIFKGGARFFAYCVSRHQQPLCR